MSKKNVRKVLDDYFMKNAYYNKRDRLRLQDNREIYNQNTLMAYIHEEYSNTSEYGTETYLIVSMQNFKSQNTWKQDKKELIEIATSSEYGMKVIFVPELDIGFGFNTKAKSWYDSIDLNFVMEKYLIDAAKFSKEDVKTAVAAIIPGHGGIPDEIIGIAYNQRDINGEVIHAEQLLCNYITSLDCNVDEYIFVSLLEPCGNCLKAMLDCKASDIYYCYLHKDKWNTPEYIQLTNDIFNKDIKHSITKMPIRYSSIYNDKVYKFMNKEKCK